MYIYVTVIASVYTVVAIGPPVCIFIYRCYVVAKFYLQNKLATGPAGTIPTDTAINAISLTAEKNIC